MAVFIRARLIEANQTVQPGGQGLRNAVVLASPHLVRAVTRGLGEGQVLLKWWRVNQHLSGTSAFAYYMVNGRRIKIYGFNGYRQVCSRILRQDGIIRADFYTDYQKASKGNSCGFIMSVALAKQKGRRYEPLERPEALETLSAQRLAALNRAAGNSEREFTQALRYASHFLVKAVREGLGERTFIKPWRVMPHESPYIYYCLDGQAVKLFGFSGHETVWSRVYQEGDRVLAGFYVALSAAQRRMEESRILTAVMSTRKKKGWKWKPSLKPATLDFGPAARVRYLKQKIKSRQLKAILTAPAEQPLDIALEPRLVTTNGEVGMGLVSKKLRFAGFRTHIGQRLYPRIVESGPQRRIYFWPSAEARDANEPAIIPAGHLVASLADGNWQLHSLEGSAHSRDIMGTLEYGKYLFANNPKKTFPIKWGIRQVTDKNGRKQLQAGKSIRGQDRTVKVPDGHGKKPVFSVTREIRGVFKFVEFWADETAYKNGEPAFAGRFIAFKPVGEPWQQFWARPWDVLRFRRLKLKKSISPDDLAAVFLEGGLKKHLTRRQFDKMLEKLDV